MWIAPVYDPMEFTAFIGLSMDIVVPDQFNLDVTGASWASHCPYKPTIGIIDNPLLGVNMNFYSVVSDKDDKTWNEHAVTDATTYLILRILPDLVNV